MQVHAAIELGGCKHVCRQLLFINLDKHRGRRVALWPSGVGDVRSLKHDCSSGFPKAKATPPGSNLGAGS